MHDHISYWFLIGVGMACSVAQFAGVAHSAGFFDILSRQDLVPNYSTQRIDERGIIPTG